MLCDLQYVKPFRSPIAVYCRGSYASCFVYFAFVFYFNLEVNREEVNLGDACYKQFLLLAM